MILRYTTVYHWLSVVYLLFGLFVGSLSAQEATPNPIFMPLNATKQVATPAVSESSVDSSDNPVSATEEPEILSDAERREHHVLRRPIALNPDRVHWVDRTYPYGGTQWGTKEVHLGVEFVNPRYTPVFAAADGVVVYAGQDKDILIGPYQDYYGYVVIIEHQIMTLDDKTVFTLYGHLDRVEVETGQDVTVGQRLGRVGSSGIALGAHLHFEVRVDDPFDFTQTRNPELWLQNYIDHGMIVGRVHDSTGDLIYGHRLVIRSTNVNREVFTYGSDRVNSDPIWQENFTVGDLPADEYEIVVLDQKGLVSYRDTVEVVPYRITFVDIELNKKDDD